MTAAGKLVVLKFDGSFQQGFRVLLEIGYECDRPSIELAGTLPPSLELASQLAQWQQSYRSLNKSNLSLNSRIQPQQIIYGGSVNRLEDCWQSATELYEQMTDWLASPTFRRLDLRLRESLSLSDAIRVIIRTQDLGLRCLPWHLWDFTERYSKAEIALSAPVCERIEIEQIATPERGVKVLAILGNSQDIDIQADRQFLQALPDASVTFLVEPSREQINHQLWDRAWDILFFAGHSATAGDRSLLHINPYESLSLEELKYGLKKAISRGLQLAIFNSCDGLGLAQALESLHLPQIIVMREPVPDRVAQEFLKSLLVAFSSGRSLYLSVREAREKLQSIENRFPCATWLPVICQNSVKNPPTWQDLRGDSAELPAQQRSYPQSGLSEKSAALSPQVDRTHRRSVCLKDMKRWWQRFRPVYRRGFGLVVLASLVVAIGVTGIRTMGWTQSWEVGAYDLMMRQRPDEGVDPRLLIVEVTDADIEAQRQNGELLERRSRSPQSYDQLFETSLSDWSLDHLLSVLAQSQPRVIGLDIYRDFAAQPDQSGLTTRLNQTRELVTVCKAEDFHNPDISSINSPPEVPLSRVGFSDFREDVDGVLRRQLLGMLPLLQTEGTRCNTNYAFSFQIAAQYLAQQQIAAQLVAGDLRLDQQTYRTLQSSASGYPPPSGGSEILLNYRATPEVATRVTLQQVLNQQVNAEYIRDKVVLVGVTAQGGEDYWFMPTRPDVAVPGVVVQAHMVSQLLSAALGQRPILTTLSAWQEIGCQWTWAAVGSFLALWLWQRKDIVRSGARLAFSLVAAVGFLYGLCFLGLLRGVWLPFVPLVLALIVSGTLALAYLHYQPRKDAISPSS